MSKINLYKGKDLYIKATQSNPYLDAFMLFSLKKQIPTFNQSLIRVRRQGDNAEQEFSFDSNGNYPLTDIVDWVLENGGANQRGRVVFWRCQITGLTINQSSGANQPFLVEGGVHLVDGNGNPTMTHRDLPAGDTGGSHFFERASLPSTPMSAISIAQVRTIDGAGRAIWNSGAFGGFEGYGQGFTSTPGNLTSQLRIASNNDPITTPIPAINTPYILSSVYTNLRHKFWVDNQLIDDVAHTLGTVTPNQPFRIGRGSATTVPMIGKVTELVLYNKDITGTVQSKTQKIMDIYGI
jgi:hypothetical protein